MKDGGPHIVAPRRLRHPEVLGGVAVDLDHEGLPSPSAQVCVARAAHAAARTARWVAPTHPRESSAARGGTLDRGTALRMFAAPVAESHRASRRRSACIAAERLGPGLFPAPPPRSPSSVCTRRMRDRRLLEGVDDLRSRDERQGAPGRVWVMVMSAAVYDRRCGSSSQRGADEDGQGPKPDALTMWRSRLGAVVVGCGLRATGRCWRMHARAAGESSGSPGGGCPS